MKIANIRECEEVMEDEMIEPVVFDETRNSLYRQLEESPGLFDTYGILADRLEELGYLSLAHAYRWCWKRQKSPHKRMNYAAYGMGLYHKGRKVPSNFRWGWYSVSVEASFHIPNVWPVVDIFPHILPSLLMPSKHCFFPTHTAAMFQLATWLLAIKNIWELEPAKEAGLQ